MQATTSSARNLPLVAGMILLIPILAYFYVTSFSFGGKAIFSVHLAVLFLLGCALFIRRLKSFLLFTMVFFIPIGLNFNFVWVRLLHYEYVPYTMGMGIDAVRIAMFMLYAMWLVEWSTGRHGQPTTLGRPIGSLLLLWMLLGLVVGLVKGVDSTYSVFEIYALFMDFLLFFYVANNIKKVEEVRIIVYAMFAGQAMQALYMLGQFATGLNYSVTGYFVPPRLDEVGFRSSGMFGGDVAATEMLAFVIPLGVAYYFNISGKARRLIMVMCLLLIVAGIFTAKNRSAGLAVIGGFLTVLVLGYLYKWASSSRIQKALFAALLLIFLASPLILVRFEQGTGAWDERLPLVQTAYNMFKDNWLVGVGPSQYLFHIAKSAPPRVRGQWHLASPVHNEYLLHLAERGIIGTILYYIILIAACVKLWRSGRSPDRWISFVSAGLLAALVGSMLFRLFHWYYHQFFNAFYFLVLGLAVSLERMENKSREQELRAEAIPKS